MLRFKQLFLWMLPPTFAFITSRAVTSRAVTSRAVTSRDREEAA
jgi:hypothetical protein